MRRRKSLDEGWMFFKGDVASAQNVAFDDADWRCLNLPHDWSIEGPFSQDHPGRPGGAHLPAGVGWYRKRFRLTEQEQRFAPPVRATTGDLHLAWDVVYQPGTLRAVGKKDGAVVCVQEIVTAGEPARIELTADREVIAADGQDVVHLTARVLDAAGNLAPTADNLIAFEVEGEGRIIGVDNSDPASHEPFQANHRRAFNDLCLTIVQAATTPGAIQVTASAPGMVAASVVVQAR